MAANIQPNAQPSASSCPTHLLNAEGDLKLVVGAEQVILQVCSRALARSSRVWKAMLYGVFREGKAQQAGEDWVVSLPEDDPEGLRILMLVVHSKLSNIPEILNRTTLFHLVVACDKYDMIEFLKPFWSGWLERVPYTYPDPEGVIQQLWIAHKLGARESYLDGLEMLLLRSETTSGSRQLCLEGFQAFDLYGDVYLQSLDVLKHLETGRRTLLKEVWARLKRAVRHLKKTQSTTCRARCSQEWKQTCGCIMFGALLRILEDHGVDGLRIDPKRLAKKHRSVSSVVTKVEKWRLDTVKESGMTKRQAGAHQDCTPWVSFTVEALLTEYSVAELFNMDANHLKSFWTSDLSKLAKHKVAVLGHLDEDHFKREAAKSGLDNAPSDEGGDECSPQ